MPSFPPPGGVTVCEINRDLVVADSLSEDRAKEAYGDVFGMVFSPIPFQPDDLLTKHDAPAPDDAEPTESVPRASLLSTIAESFKQMLFPSCDPKLLEEFDTQKVSWNPHKHCLAFVSGKDQVTVHDFEDSDGKESCILMSELQKEVKAIEWRPNSGKMIAVGCKGGICLWSASYPGNVPSVKSGVTSSSFGAFPRGSSGQWILVDVLRGSSTEIVSALCWKPDGRYLASASCNGQSFTIWDVSQGLGTPIRRGLSSISLVRWSPSGDYLLTAKFDGTFHLWETNTWTSEPWSSSNGYVTVAESSSIFVESTNGVFLSAVRDVSGANWDPEGRVALLSFSNSTTLGSIHFSSKPPSLDAHLLPVELPEISSLIVSRGIEKLAWDASGERLAVSFKDGNETYHGLLAVYDVRRSPLVSVSLVGFIRGPGEGVKPLAFAFHNKFKQGPLLSVCWSSGWCCTYPLILRSH